MANPVIPAGFLEARYPWMTVQGTECYPSRDFLYLILSLWNRTGGSQGSGSSSIYSSSTLSMFSDESSGGGDDGGLMIPGPPGTPGTPGLPGATGAPGAPGPALVIDVPEPDEPMLTMPRTAPGGWFDEKGLGGSYGFMAGVDFTAGTTTALTLSQPYGAQSNLIVAFDGTWQGADQFTLSGKTLTFTSAIPVGTNKVFVKGFLMPQ